MLAIPGRTDSMVLNGARSCLTSRISLMRRPMRIKLIIDDIDSASRWSVIDTWSMKPNIKPQTTTKSYTAKYYRQDFHL